MGHSFTKVSCRAVVFTTLLVVTAAVCGQAAEAHRLTVSEGLVEGNDRPLREAADVFAEHIELGRDFSTKRGLSRGWNDVPRDSKAETHVTIVDLRFANRLELLAFMFDENGTIARAARAPALYQDDPWFAWTMSPGDNQWPANAPADLVARFADVFERPGERTGLYQIVVQDWETDTDILNEDLLPGESLSPKQGETKKILPLAAAALVADGFGVTIKPTEDTIVLKVRMGELDCAIHATRRRGDKTLGEIKRYGISYEGLYDGLRILFLNLIEWPDSIVDWFRPAVAFEPLRVFGVDNPDGLLDARKTILVGKDRDGFTAIDVATGERVWSVPFEERGGSGTFLGGQMFLLRRSVLTRLSTTGEREYSLTTRKTDLLGFCGDRCAEGFYHSLRLFRAGEEAWSKTLPWTIEAGPLVSETRILVSDARGVLRCLTFEGEEAWTVVLSRPVCGEIHTGAGLFFAVDEAGTLHAVDQEGTPAWQAQIGDVMTGPPRAFGDAVVVGSKSARLFVFDRNTGECLRERHFESWLLGFEIVDNRIMCVTLGGRLHVLDAESLEDRKVLRFPFELNPHVLPVQDFHRRRARGAVDGQTKNTGCLVSDVKGHVFVYSSGTAEGDER